MNLEDNLENIELRSEKVGDILSQMPPWLIRWGSLLFLIMILMVLSLSWFIKYPDIITTKAFLTTKIPPQKEYAKISGKIDTILVSDGQKVIKNSLLSILENTAKYEDVYFLKSLTDTINIEANNIDFPFENLPFLVLGEIEASYTNFEDAYFKYSLNRSQQPYSYQLNANDSNLNEFNKRLKNLILQQEIEKSELVLKNKDFERSTSLFKKGIISEQQFENKKLEYLNSKKKYQDIQIDISRLRETMNNNKKISKEINFNRTREDTQVLRKVLSSYNQLKKSIKEWELKYVLKSNINGRVSFLNYWSKNQTVQKGDLVFTIIPEGISSNYYIARLKAISSNSGKIRVNQDVNLKLYDYPQYEFGVIRGKVNKISSTVDKAGNYIIEVSIPENLTTSYGIKIDFKQEMQGEADIITEDLRLLERVFFQLKDVVRTR